MKKPFCWHFVTWCPLKDYAYLHNPACKAAGFWEYVWPFWCIPAVKSLNPYFSTSLCNIMAVGTGRLGVPWPPVFFRKVKVSYFKNHVNTFYLAWHKVESWFRCISSKIMIKFACSVMWVIVYRVLLNHALSSIQLHPPPPSSTQLHIPPPSSFQPPLSSLHLHPAHFSLQPALCNTLNNIWTKILHVTGQFPQILAEKLKVVHFGWKLAHMLY